MKIMLSLSPKSLAAILNGEQHSEIMFSAPNISEDKNGQWTESVDAYLVCEKGDTVLIRDNQGVYRVMSNSKFRRFYKGNNHALNGYVVARATIAGFEWYYPVKIKDEITSQSFYVPKGASRRLAEYEQELLDSACITKAELIQKANQNHHQICEWIIGRVFAKEVKEISDYGIKRMPSEWCLIK